MVRKVGGAKYSLLTKFSFAKVAIIWQIRFRNATASAYKTTALQTVVLSSLVTFLINYLPPPGAAYESIYGWVHDAIKRVTSLPGRRKVPVQQRAPATTAALSTKNAQQNAVQKHLQWSKTPIYH
jgi:hypothetical protein